MRFLLLLKEWFLRAKVLRMDWRQNENSKPDKKDTVYRSWCSLLRCGNQSFHFFTGSRCIIIWVSGPNSFLSLCSTLEQWA